MVLDEVSEVSLPTHLSDVGRERSKRRTRRKTDLLIAQKQIWQGISCGKEYAHLAKNLMIIWEKRLRTGILTLREERRRKTK